MKRYLPTEWIIFFSIFILSTIYSIPYIVNDFIYEDDYQRLFYGYSGWSANGRPFADFIYSIISPGNGVLDIHPLGQIITIFICATIGYLFSKRYAAGAVTSTLVSLSLFCHPFYLENLAYRFDSLTMSISLLFSTLPFLVRVDNKYISYVFGSFCVFVFLSTYQISMNVYLCFFSISLIFTDKDTKLKSYIIYGASHCSKLLTGSVTYMIMSSFLVTGQYSESLSKTVNTVDGSIITAIEKNISRISLLTKSLIDGSGFLLYSSLFIIFALVSIIALVIYSRKNASYLFLLLIASLIVLFVFKGGILLLLAHPVVFPRTAMGFGAVLAFLFSVMSVGMGRLPKSELMQSVAGLLLFFYFTTISYAYANDLNRQSEMQNNVMKTLIPKIDNYNIKALYVSGMHDRRSTLLLNYYHNRISGKLPIFSWLAPTIFGRWGWIMGTDLKMNGFDGFKGEVGKDSVEYFENAVCRDSIWFSYCIAGDKMLVKF